MKLKDFFPAGQAYNQAIDELNDAVKAGTLKTPSQMKDFLDKRLKELLEIQKKMIIIAHKSQIIGLVEGALLSFLGGMLASSIFWWVDTKSPTSVVVGIACTVSFVIALGLVLGKIKNIPSL